MSTAMPRAIPTPRMAVLFCVMLVAAAGNTAMQSILPAIGAKLSIPDVWVSLAFSWSALLWVMTAPRWARQSDRRGRKALMKLGVTGFILSMAACGLTLWAGLAGWLGAGITFIVFALFRSLYGGLGSAAPPAVQAYVAARTDGSERTKALSLLSSSFGLGTVIGPALAPFLILPLVGLAGPMLMFALFGSMVLIALRLLPDDMPRYPARGMVSDYPGSGSAAPPGGRMDDGRTDAPPDGDATGAQAQAASAESPVAASPPRLKWHDPRVRPWFVSGLLGGHAQAMLLGVIGFLLLDRLGLRATPDSAAEPTGLVLMAGAGASLIAQWGLIPMLEPRPRTAVIAGAALGALGCTMTGLADDLHSIAIGFAVASLGFGLFRPGFTAGASFAVPQAQQGGVAGITASINGAAYVGAPAFGVLLYNWHPAVSFAVMALPCAFLVGWGWRALRLPNESVA